MMTHRNTCDSANRLTGIVNGNGTVPPVDQRAYAYNSANQRTGMTNADGSYRVYQYDALGQVTNGVKKWANNNLVAGEQFGYGFDTIGNRTMALAGGDQNGANRRQAGYTANNLNEYTSRTVPGAADVIGMATNTATVWVNQTAAYRSNNYFWLGMPVNNASGPVYQTVTTLAALTNGNATNAEYGVTNIGHVFVPRTPENFGYDWDGNLTNDGHWSYYWDGENRLVAMTNNAGIVAAGEYTLAFAYDYQGRRIQKLVCTNSGLAYVPEYTNRFLYDGWNLVAILNPNASIAAAMMWGTDLSGSAQGAGGVGGLLAENLAANGVHFVAYDGNGNVTALVSASSGTVTANYEYGPFGEVIRATGPMAKVNPFMFATKYYDWETGLYYYGHRYYNPSTGRWPSRDPIGEKGGMNLYGFLGNDGVDFVDPFGLEQWKNILKEINRLDKLASSHPCCNAQGAPLPLGALFPHLAATASGTTVTGTATYTVGGRGPVRVLDYVWWNCFDADREGRYWWGRWRLYSDWQDYGWNYGDATKSEAVTGAILPPSQDYFDSGHWNWKVCIIYLYCDGGHFHVTYNVSPEVMFDWNASTTSWTNPHDVTGAD